MNLLFFAVPIIICALITMLDAKTLMFAIVAIFAGAAMLNLTEIMKAITTQTLDITKIPFVLGFCGLLVVIGLTVKSGK